MRTLTAIFLILVLLLAAGAMTAQTLQPDQPQTTITVSGTVNGPGGPVPNVWIGIGSPQDWQATSTNGSGFYTVSIATGGDLWFAVRPGLSTGLAQYNRLRQGVTGNLTQDFILVNGHLLSLRVTGKNGAIISHGPWFDVQPLENSLADREWYDLDWDGSLQRFQAVLPPDIYLVTANNLPVGYFQTGRSFDLRTADKAPTMPLNTTFVHPIPYDPPDASKITIGPVDDLGEATVSGTAGAAMPLAHVLLVNLNSTHQDHTISAADGSFSARIYAPPGSAILVKHGPAGWRWQTLDAGLAEGVNPFPGTIINVAHTHAGSSLELPFAAAGAVEYLADDPATTQNYVGSAYALSGTLSPVVVDGQWTRVFSGTYQSEADPGLYRGGLNWTHPSLADLDDDNDLDLLVGERSGRLTLYRNLGTANIPNWQFETAAYAGVATGEWAYPALVDVTNDGAPDLFVGTGSGLVQIFYNTGTAANPGWPETPDTTLTAQPSAAPALADLDNDGDLDLLVGQGNGQLSHFENSGSLANPSWTQRSQSYGSISEPGHNLQPAFVDLDGDNDLDLLIGRCGDLVWYRNNGPPANPSWTRVTEGYMGIGGSCAFSPGLGDWDNDGDADLVTGQHWGVLRFFRNNTPPNWVEENFAFPFELSGDSAPALADWDNDGDLDLLIGQAHGEVHQYRNIGSAASANWQPEGVLLTLPWTNHPHAFPALADIDNDQDFDLFIGKGGWQGPGAGGVIHYYQNNGTPATPNWTLVSDNWLGLDVGGWSTPVFVDIDNDNDLDLFVGGEDGTLTFVQNNGTPAAPVWAAPVNPYAGLDLGAYSAPAFHDVDDDGDLDMLVGLEHGSLAYVRNIGTVNAPSWDQVANRYPGIELGGNAVPAAADLNNDGQSDLIIGGLDGGLHLYLYDGPGTPPAAGDAYAPGDLFQVQGQVRLYSPAITAASDVNAITLNSSVNLQMITNQAGDALPAQNSFMSTMLTPTGFPIQRVRHPGVWVGGGLALDNLHHAGGHTIEGDFVYAGKIPEDLPAGTFRPVIYLDFNGVPANTDWLAANVTGHYTFTPHEAALPPINVGAVDPPRLLWRLMMDDVVQGNRGAGALEDQGKFQISSQIVSQGAPFYVPPVDAHTGQPITYRLEPFLPMISFTDRRLPAPPLIPFDLPGGQLCVVLQEPDGGSLDLGCEAFAQSFNRTKTSRGGQDLNSGTVQLEDVYSLMVASDRFRVNFDQYGRHTITLTGQVNDLWGNSYSGGGTYEVWAAQPLDIDPGMLPGTPLTVNEPIAPTMQFYPRVPAQVTLRVTHYPDSDPAQVETHTISGQANAYGFFSPADTPIKLTSPGEYRIDVSAIYTQTNGALYLGNMTWGSVVMTPPIQADLIAHGRRGLDALNYIPNHWFVAARDLTILPGAIPHALNPYYNGDILWSRESAEDQGGSALIMGASVQDTSGIIEAAVQSRAQRMYPATAPPGDLAERFSNGEIPLFTSTYSGLPAQMVPDDIDQFAYSYRTSQRPGVRVREIVAEDGETGGYWRLNTVYDDQLGVGILGDQPNDFKFQYVGVVYRDLDSGHNEYLGQGSGWVFIPPDDPLGNRVMPPFAGPGNGGWTTEGGPILTLKGQEIHMFILPTGTQPGAVLEIGDRFRFAGHLMPTLSSQVAVTVTAPSGAQHYVAGQASPIGYFYDPADDFIVNEAGLWSVDVHVWHNGLCSGGATVPPYPSGDVLGSDNGRYWFYVVPAAAPRLSLLSPTPGFLSFGNQVTPITISGPVPAGLNGVTVDYTITMPGFILDHGQVTPSGSTFEILFDPTALHDQFPNLDLIGRDDYQAGLSDTFAINLLLRGHSGGQQVYRANTVTLQGQQVFIGKSYGDSQELYLPLILRGG